MSPVVRLFPTLRSSAEWYAHRALAAFRARWEHPPCAADDRRASARYLLHLAKALRGQATDAGQRAGVDPW